MECERSSKRAIVRARERGIELEKKNHSVIPTSDRHPSHISTSDQTLARPNELLGGIVVPGDKDCVPN